MSSPFLLSLSSPPSTHTCTHPDPSPPTRSLTVQIGISTCSVHPYPREEFDHRGVFSSAVGVVQATNAVRSSNGEHGVNLKYDLTVTYAKTPPPFFDQELRLTVNFGSHCASDADIGTEVSDLLDSERSCYISLSIFLYLHLSIYLSTYIHLRDSHLPPSHTHRPNRSTVSSATRAMESSTLSSTSLATTRTRTRRSSSARARARGPGRSSASRAAFSWRRTVSSGAAASSARSKRRTGSLAGSSPSSARSWSSPKRSSTSSRRGSARGSGLAVASSDRS